MDINDLKKELTTLCPSLTVERLSKLTNDQIYRIDHVDTWWCEYEWKDTGFDSAEEAIRMALFAEYEEIVSGK